MEDGRTIGWATIKNYLISRSITNGKDFLKLEVQLQASAESTSKDQTSVDSMGFRTAKYKAYRESSENSVNSVAMNLIVDCDILISIVTRSGFIRHCENMKTLYNTIDM